jgi:hypothetical protein
MHTTSHFFGSVEDKCKNDMKQKILRVGNMVVCAALIYMLVIVAERVALIVFAWSLKGVSFTEAVKLGLNGLKDGAHFF